LGHSVYDVIVETQTMKPFTVPEMTFKGHSVSSAMSSFIRSPGPSIRDFINMVCSNYVYSTLINHGVPLKFGLTVIQGH